MDKHQTFPVKMLRVSSTINIVPYFLIMVCFLSFSLKAAHVFQGTFGCKDIKYYRKAAMIV